MLAALLTAMTVGTGLLLVMETSPARFMGPTPSLAAHIDARETASASIERALHTSAPARQWQYIVVHDSVCPDSDNVVAGSHFVIFANDGKGPDGEIQATRRWTDQREGDHIYLPGHDLNASSIGVCIVGDTDGQAPSAAQMDSLRVLVRQLQQRYGIPADRVVLHRDWDPGSRCPGQGFPAAQFTAGLLQPR